MKSSALSRLRLGSLGVVALVAMATSYISRPAAIPTVSASTNLIHPGPIVRRAVETSGALFKLGDAAGPFGWSTVIGDLNADGRLDVAVADRIARYSDEYAYRLEFREAGRPPQSVIFELAQSAITIALADVDRDNDLDLVVNAPLSGETLAVWLNDGSGHFRAGERADVSNVRRAPRELGRSGSRPAASADISVPRGAAAACVDVRSPFGGERRGRAITWFDRVRPTRVHFTVPSRAPPLLRTVLS